MVELSNFSINFFFFWHMLCVELESSSERDREKVPQKLSLIGLNLLKIRIYDMNYLI